MRRKEKAQNMRQIRQKKSSDSNRARGCLKSNPALQGNNCDCTEIQPERGQKGTKTPSKGDSGSPQPLKIEEKTIQAALTYVKRPFT